MDWKFVLILIFAIFVAIFAIQNASPVDIQFLNFEFNDVSQAVVILLSAIAGAFIVMLFSLIRWIKYTTKLKGSSKSISALESEMKQLKQKLEEETAKGAAANRTTEEVREELRKTQEALETAKSNIALPVFETGDAPEQSTETSDEPGTAGVSAETSLEASAKPEEAKTESVGGIRKWLGF